MPKKMMLTRIVTTLVAALATVALAGCSISGDRQLDNSAQTGLVEYSSGNDWKVEVQTDSTMDIRSDNPDKRAIFSTQDHPGCDAESALLEYLDNFGIERDIVKERIGGRTWLHVNIMDAQDIYATDVSGGSVSVAALFASAGDVEEVALNMSLN